MHYPCIRVLWAIETDIRNQCRLVSHVQAWGENYPRQIPGEGLRAKTPEAENKCACELHIYMYTSMEDKFRSILCNLSLLLPVYWSMEEIPTTTEDMGAWMRVSGSTCDICATVVLLCSELFFSSF